jgi:IS5 family transposase
VPVAFDLVPGGLHDLTPIHELTFGLPEGATVYGDKGYNAGPDEATILADTGVHLVPLRTANRAPNRWAEKLALRAYRKRIETLYSQFEAMGLERLRARTNPGLELKVHASLLAVTIANAD